MTVVVQKRGSGLDAVAGATILPNRPMADYRTDANDSEGKGENHDESSHGCLFTGKSVTFQIARFKEGGQPFDDG